MKKALGIIYLLCFVTFLCSAQKSVFEQDTVAFRYFVTDERDQIVSQGSSKEIGSLSNDTIRYWRYVFMDKNGMVHWREDSLQFDSYIYFMLEKAGITDESIRSLPPFKVIRDGLTFKYVTAGKNPTIIFQASLSTKNAIMKAPFFLAWTINGGVPWGYEFEEMSYTQDTTLLIAGRSIPCYRFTKFETNFPEVVTGFGATFSEIYFEKSSLLPIIISRRAFSRYYNNERLDDGTKIGYTLLYFHRKIEPRW